MRRAEIEEQNQYLLKRQRDFRLAADIVTDALAPFEEVEAISLIGSVAKPLWKEIPRFREFRDARIKVWHECKDLDLAVWVSSQHRLGPIRHAKDVALRDGYERGVGPSIASHELDIFLIEPGTDRYLGRLCRYNACPKNKPNCWVSGCGAMPFNKVVDGFVADATLLAPAAYAMLYRRGEGRLRSALDLPATDDTEPA